jgi:ribonuclease HI
MQRLATIAITGAFKSTPVDILNAHANVPPMELQVQKKCHRAALRLAVVPEHHPMFKIVRRAARQRVGSHNSQLHELYSMYPDTHPDNVEVIPSTGRAPWTRLSCSTSIAKDKAEAAEEDGEERAEDALVVYSDGSLVDGGAGAAAVLYKGRTRMAELRYHLGKSDEHTVFEAEGVGVILGAKLVWTYGSGVEDIEIALDNQAVIRALESTKPQPGAHILTAARHLLHQLQRRQRVGTVLHIRWVPGHLGIEGNEAADEEAKAAARGRSSEPHRMPKFLKQGLLPRSFSSVVESFNKKLKGSWKEIWKGGKTYLKMKKIDPKLPSRSYLELVTDLTRRQSSIIMQLRAGHLPLNSYLHWITKRDSPDCSHPRCAGRHETVFHYLLECPAYDKERREILGKHGRKAGKISYLLGDPKCIKDTVKFIAATKRFGKTQ